MLLLLIANMIIFKYKPTFSHYWALQRYVLYGNFRFFLVVFVLPLLGFLIAPFVVRNLGAKMEIVELYKQLSPALIFPLVYLALLPISYFICKKRWRNFEVLREERGYEVDESGIRVTGETWSGFLAWQNFSNADYRNGLLFIKTKQKSFHCFPLSLIPNKNVLIELVSRKVKISQSLNLLKGLSGA